MADIQLSDHFTYRRLLRFVLPSINMMLFASIYGVVDGLFVSNFVGKIPFAAVNLIMPAIMILGPLGMVIGTGGSAIVAKTMGEGDYAKANRYFSLMIYATIIGGAILSIIGFIFMRPISLLLGADGPMLEYCVLYGRLSMISLAAFMVENAFQSFMITAERPKMGFHVTLISGLTNMALDALFIACFHWGVAGAALATAASEYAGAIIPLVFFLRQNSTPLQLGRTDLEWGVLGRTCVNGSSEFVSNTAFSIVSMIYNLQLLRLAGENGVAAYGVMMYVNFIFVAIFFGYTLGAGPIISFHFGAKNTDELKNLFRKSMVLMILIGFGLSLLAFAAAHPLAKLFVGYDPELFEMTRTGLRLYALGFTLVGLNIFGSALFTALNNGQISALISMVRSFVFKIVTVMSLPLVFGLNGIWLSMLASEFLSLLLTLFFIVRKRGKYQYY